MRKRTSSENGRKRWLWEGVGADEAETHMGVLQRSLVLGPELV